jgi:hypothetical protein
MRIETHLRCVRDSRLECRQLSARHRRGQLGNRFGLGLQARQQHCGLALRVAL